MSNLPKGVKVAIVVSQFVATIAVFLYANQRLTGCDASEDPCTVHWLRSIALLSALAVLSVLSVLTTRLSLQSGTSNTPLFATIAMSVALSVIAALTQYIGMGVDISGECPGVKILQLISSSLLAGFSTLLIGSVVFF